MSASVSHIALCLAVKGLTAPALMTAPDQLVLNSALVTLEVPESSDTARVLGTLGCDKCAPAERRARRCAKRSREVGTAKAAVARSTWKKRAEAYMAASKGGEVRRLDWVV